MEEKQLQETEQHYSDASFWDKVKRVALKAGSSVIYAVLLLYYTLQKPTVPKKAKAVIIGALGYFIFPFDFIPDIAAGFGYTDDFGALIFALAQVAMYIDDDIKAKAKETLERWFPNADTAQVDQHLQ